MKANRLIAAASVVLSICNYLAAEQTNCPPLIGSSLALHENYLKVYQKDKLRKAKYIDQLTKKDGIRIGSCLGIEAWVVPPGSMVFEYTPGMTIIQKVTWFVGGIEKEAALDVRRIAWNEGEVVLQIPNTTESDGPLNKQGDQVRKLFGDRPSLVFTPAFETGTSAAGSKTRQAHIIQQESQIADSITQITNQYGKATVSKKVTPNGLMQSEVMKWTVGDGGLEIETTLGTGIVKDITYVVGNEHEKNITRIKVKDVDLTKGEMTLFIPGQSDTRSAGGDTEGKK